MNTSSNIEINDKICPVCGVDAVEEIPTEVFWCEKCAVPVITLLSAENKNVCPLCSEKTKKLSADIRPVFPEEKLLLAVLLNKTADFFMNCSIWASGSRYYVDGKPFNVSTKFFEETDADLIEKKMSSAVDAINYTHFDSDIKKFISANRYRFFALKDEAISFVQRTAKNFPEENIVISFSGGKDSTVVADIVVKALNNPSLVHIFGNTTLEFPMTIEYAARYRKNHPFAIFQTAVNDEQNFFSVCEDIGPPARMMRWCCSMFKTGPISRVINSLYRSQKILTFYGIRKAESVARSKYNRVEGDSESIKIRQQIVASPVFYWKDADVWLYILSEKIDFNFAYRLGYDRVGCWCCPNNTQRAQFLSRVYMPNESKNWRDFLVEFAKKIGKPDPEIYVDSGKWKARQGGNGLISANDVKLKFTNCTTEEHAKIYQLNKNFTDEFLNLFVPFGKVAPELGRKILHETLVLDCKTNVPILSISPFNQGTAVKTVSGDKNFFLWEDFFMKRIKWDVEEIVAMVDLYFRFENGEIADLNEELKKLSEKLNRRADILGIVHNEKFRNLNGMKCIFQNVRYFATDGETGLSNGNELQGEVVEFYFHNRKIFDELLKNFNEKYC